MSLPNSPGKSTTQSPAGVEAPKIPDAEKAAADKLAQEKAATADSTRTQIETERRIDVTNSALTILENFCKDGKLDSAKDAVQKIEMSLKAGDIIYVQGLWISVTEKDSGSASGAKEKQFSMLGGSSTSAPAAHLYDLLDSQNFFPKDDAGRAEKLKKIEEERKDPFLAVRQNLLKLLQTAFSGKKLGDEKLSSFFTEISAAFPTSDLSGYDTPEKFSEGVGGKLGKPFETLLGDNKFSRDIVAGLKPSLEEAYKKLKQPPNPGDVIANLLGSANMSDFWMKFLEQFMDVLNSGSLMIGASNTFMTNKLKEPRTVDPALAGLNTPVLCDLDNKFRTYKTGEQISFACEALGLPKDYGNFQGQPDGLESFYRHLTEDRKIAADVRELTQKPETKSFLDRLQPGDLIFSVNTDLKGRGTFMERVARVDKIEGKDITITYLPESKDDVAPKTELLSDVKIGSLYASLRPPMKARTAVSAAAPSAAPVTAPVAPVTPAAAPPENPPKKTES
ncbi:MAG: hypothetical protein AAB551_01485 [Patescibacteria group bacterium]